MFAHFLVLQVSVSFGQQKQRQTKLLDKPLSASLPTNASYLPVNN